MKDKISDYILKYSEHKNSELKYDFMPNVLEIIERPAHKAGKIIIYLVFSLLIVTIIWSCIAKTDVVVTAKGQLIPEGNIVTVKSYLSGNIKNIYVNNGQSVKKGDILIELDAGTETDITYIKEQISVVEAEIDVYSKLIGGTDVSQISLKNYTEDCKSNIEIIIEKENSYSLSKKSLELSQKSAKLEYDNAVATKESYKNNSELFKAQEQIVQQKKLQLENAELKIQNLDIEHKQEINNIYSEKKSELSNLNTQMKQYQKSEKYTHITATVDGYISNLAVNSIGDIVNSYQELMSIIPSDVPLQMECYIQNKDIADINIGDEVQIKLDAYSYSDYGTVSGKIIYISPNSDIVDNIGNVYRVISEIENYNENIKIIPGLSGSLEIKTGQRSIMSYFLEPILNGFNGSLKEK